MTGEEARPPPQSLVYNIGMQFEVPQFIEIEDKIFGPFTWRQFLYLGGGGAVAVVLFLTVHWIFFLLIGIPIGLFAAALAFYPINNRPFSYFVESAYNYLRGQKLYLWNQKRDFVHKQKFAPSSTTDHIRNPIPQTSKPHKDIHSLARNLELKAIQKQ